MIHDLKVSILQKPDALISSIAKNYTMQLVDIRYTVALACLSSDQVSSQHLG